MCEGVMLDPKKSDKMNVKRMRQALLGPSITSAQCKQLQDQMKRLLRAKVTLLSSATGAVMDKPTKDDICQKPSECALDFDNFARLHKAVFDNDGKLQSQWRGQDLGAYG